MKKILIICPSEGRGGGAQIVLDELLNAWHATSLELILASPENSLIQQTAIRQGFKHVLFRGSLNLRDNLREIRAKENEMPEADLIVSWTMRGFPAARWFSKKRNMRIAGVLHDNPYSRKIRGAVFWDLRRFPYQSSNAWKKMIWSSREYIFRTWWRWQWAHRSANSFSQLICVSDAVRQDCIRKGYRCPLAVVRNGLADMPIPERAPSEKVRVGFLGLSGGASKGFNIVEQWIPMFGNQAVWKLYGQASESTLKRIEKLKEDREQPSSPQASPSHGRSEDRGRRSEVEDQTLDSHQKPSENEFLTTTTHQRTTGHSGLIDYRGFQDRETIFGEIDVLVHASPTFDSLPTVLIEAARAGLPCIASSNGGAGEIVENGVSGFIFDPKNPEEGFEKLKQLLDPELRREMGSNARKIFEERFRVERMVREYEKVFEQLSRSGDVAI